MDVARAVPLLLSVAACALLPATAWASGDGARSLALHVPAGAGTAEQWRKRR